MKTPVAFFFFHRMDAALRVFERIREARPETLLLIADGPRPEREGEAERCARLREAIEERIDWPCQVLRNYAGHNLGCRERIASGTDWVFQNVSECVLLEDDCLPDPSFFPFCSELLERYRNEERVMMISGNNFTSADYSPRTSYTFTSYPHCWGWATWRRAWSQFDVTMKDWPKVRDGSLRSGWLADSARVERRRSTLEATFRGEIDTWDFQWMLAIWKAGGLSVQPSVNLVANIGFGEGATHTLDACDPSSQLAACPMPFPRAHPPKIQVDPKADRFEEPLRLWRKALRRLGRLGRVCKFQ